MAEHLLPALAWVAAHRHGGLYGCAAHYGTRQLCLAPDFKHLHICREREYQQIES